MEQRLQPGRYGLHYANADLVNSGVLDATRPLLMGQLFHLFKAPNRFGLPVFYTLHMWARKENPNGAFVNRGGNVTCELFAGEKP